MEETPKQIFLEVSVNGGSHCSDTPTGIIWLKHEKSRRMAVFFLKKWPFKKYLFSLSGIYHSIDKASTHCTYKTTPYTNTHEATNYRGHILFIGKCITIFIFSPAGDILSVPRL